MDVSENSGTPKSSISIGFSIINHPFWGTSIFGNIQMFQLFSTYASLWFSTGQHDMNGLKMLKPQGDQCQTLDETASIELPTTPNAWDMKVFPCSKLNFCYNIRRVNIFRIRYGQDLWFSPPSFWLVWCNPTFGWSLVDCLHERKFCRDLILLMEESSTTWDG